MSQEEEQNTFSRLFNRIKRFRINTKGSVSAAVAAVGSALAWIALSPGEAFEKLTKTYALVVTIATYVGVGSSQPAESKLQISVAECAQQSGIAEAIDTLGRPPHGARLKAFESKLAKRRACDWPAIIHSIVKAEKTFIVQARDPADKNALVQFYADEAAGSFKDGDAIYVSGDLLNFTDRELLELSSATMKPRKVTKSVKNAAQSQPQQSDKRSALERWLGIGDSPPQNKAN